MAARVVRKRDLHDDDDVVEDDDVVSSDDDAKAESTEFKKYLKELPCDDSDVPCIEKEIYKAMLGQQPPVQKQPRVEQPQVSTQQMFAKFTTPMVFPVRQTPAMSNVVVPTIAQDLSHIFECGRTQNRNTLYVVVFFREGCGACTHFKSAIAPTLHAKYPNVVFVYVDVMNASFKPYTDNFKIQSVPTLIYLKACAVLAQQVGADGATTESYITRFK